MNVNGITSVTSAYSGYNTYNNEVVKAASAVETEGAVYEKSNKKMSEADRSALIERLKADSQNRVAQLQGLVEKMFQKQGIVIGTADEMWRKLASGEFTADADTIAKAKEDISEDGYWGVKQTSERIFEFAKTLANGDMDKMKEMQEAFEKGFKQATKTWGQELPEISGQTYDAVNEMFEDYYSAE